MPLSGYLDSDPPSAVPERANILIVDDLPEKLLVFETILADLGQNLVIVRSGSEALREVLRQEFAVILLDVNMPGIDGLETARLIRGYRRSAHTPIIFITAYADEMQTSQGYSLGAVDYILSPVIPDVLRSKVRVFVDLFIMQQRLRQQALERIAIARAEAAQRAAEENTRRSQFLAQAGRELSDSLDAEVAMRRLLRLLVPRFAAKALLWLRDAGRGHERVLRCDAAGGEHEPPMFTEGRAEVLSEVLYTAVRDVVTPGDTLSSTMASEPAAAPGSSHVALPGRRETPQGVVITLQTGERLLGGLVLCDPVRPADWATLDELASRAAIAFENARLYGALQAEIIERRQAEAGLLEASRRKDEFLAMLSHELRNPLAPIRSAAEVMRALLPAGSDGRLTQAVSVTDRQVKHLTRLVDELLDVARISQGKIVLKTEQLDLRALVRQGVEAVQTLIDQQQQTLHVTLPPAPVVLRGDGARLIQVVTNLLHNAAKYTGPGGTITLRLEASATGIELTVSDNGRGIEPSLLPHVFDLFEQGPSSLDRHQGGLGVGLTLVQRLVQLHHGEVQALSEGAGRGSTFIVTLPAGVDASGAVDFSAGSAAESNASGAAGSGEGEAVRSSGNATALTTSSPSHAPASTAAPVAPVAPVAIVGSGASYSLESDGPVDRVTAVTPIPADAGACHVLVVDDNRDAADSMAMFLQLAGFDTTIALDGPKALAHVATRAPQVILLDIGLPGLDGYEVARQLRALPATRDALLIALTGYGQQDDRRQAHDAGFDVHLVKPADPDAVVDLIQEWRQRERGPKTAAATAAEAAAR